jgi:hypothetical protein
MTDLTKYVRTPTPATADVRTFLNTELAKIQAATDTFFKMLGDLNMLAGIQEGTADIVVRGSTVAGVGTYTGRKCQYTKIGKLVVINGYVQWSAHTGTGNMSFGPLPFPAQSDIYGVPVYLVGVGGVPNTDVGFLSLVGTDAYVSVQTAGGAAQQAMVGAGDIRFIAAYFAVS